MNSKEKVMKKFEYRHELFDMPPTQYNLKKYGEEGWELVTCINLFGCDLTLIFKREIL